MNRESESDMRGVRLTRDERKALRKADLLDCPVERREVLRVKAEQAIAHLVSGRERCKSGGIIVSDEQHRWNCASHVLMLECLAELV